MPNSIAISPSNSAQPKVLHSWKDIANYTGRGVRTLQRYEAKLGFPIHRPAGKSRSAVLAFPKEIDEWLGKAPMTSTAPRPLRPLTANELRERQEWRAVTANAKLSRERARVAYEGCRQQSKRVQEMVERIKAARTRLNERPALFA